MQISMSVEQGDITVTSMRSVSMCLVATGVSARTAILGMDSFVSVCFVWSERVCNCVCEYIHIAAGVHEYTTAVQCKVNVCVCVCVCVCR